MGDLNDHLLWEQTPKWHWRYWIGYRMRRWSYDDDAIAGEYDGAFRYQTHKKRARQSLEERYGREEKHYRNSGPSSLTFD